MHCRDTPATRRTRQEPSGFLTRGRHNFTIGGDVRRHHVDILSQQDPRGGFTFTGSLTGSDFADFLLGIPSTSQIAYGNADKYLRATPTTHTSPTTGESGPH